MIWMAGWEIHSAIILQEPEKKTIEWHYLQSNLEMTVPTSSNVIGESESVPESFARFTSLIMDLFAPAISPQLEPLRHLLNNIRPAQITSPTIKIQAPNYTWT